MKTSSKKSQLNNQMDEHYQMGKDLSYRDFNINRVELAGKGEKSNYDNVKLAPKVQLKDEKLSDNASVKTDHGTINDKTIPGAQNYDI